MVYLLGISAFYHDSAAAVVADGRIVAAAQEERFTRKKNDAGFPHHAIQYCLDEAGIKLGAVDYVVFYDKPFLKFERLLETYLAFAPRGLQSFRVALPIWIGKSCFRSDCSGKSSSASRPITTATTGSCSPNITRATPLRRSSLPPSMRLRL